jgi:flagellar basal-body rod protein FlgC
MSMSKIFDIAGSAMSAQSTRLNTVASNLANADVASATAEGAYKARHPVFASVLSQVGADARGSAGVQVTGIMQSDQAPRMEYMPGHPLANSDGYVYFSNVNTVEEMADMMSASRSYQNNVEMLQTIKELMLRTLQLGDH